MQVKLMLESKKNVSEMGLKRSKIIYLVGKGKKDIEDLSGVLKENRINEQYIGALLERLVSDRILENNDGQYSLTELGNKRFGIVQEYFEARDIETGNRIEIEKEIDWRWRKGE